MMNPCEMRMMMTMTMTTSLGEAKPYYDLLESLEAEVSDEQSRLLDQEHY